MDLYIAFIAGMILAHLLWDAIIQSN